MKTLNTSGDNACRLSTLILFISLGGHQAGPDRTSHVFQNERRFLPGAPGPALTAYPTVSPKTGVPRHPCGIGDIPVSWSLLRGARRRRKLPATIMPSGVLATMFRKVFFVVDR